MTLAVLSAPVSATNVKLVTSMGDIEIGLLDSVAPGTVQNFLNYVNDGDYINSFIHRSVPGFVIQGGGYTFVEGTVASVPADAAVTNEYQRSNQRGTVAMARLGGQPNSATNQWFINLDDNSNPLDTTDGGFTVFGEVLGEGMAVAEAIAALTTYNAGSPFGELPLIQYDGVSQIQAANLVLITAVEVDADGDRHYSDDAFPDDANEYADTDNDGTGNNADTDDDGDGLPDEVEMNAGLDPLNDDDAALDMDEDGYSNLQEYNAGTDLTSADDSPGTRAADTLKVVFQVLEDDEGN
ncbi:MAG: peptidylprolyl isomerase [Gammaproteobacteria bacterium]|nr:peptidylprolyl isomerase [Gammaproteobacteria bacterium]